MTEFVAPPHAGLHCRFYSYERAARWEDSGPKCAVGLSLEEPGSCGRCMPEARGTCASRQEWTTEERAAWQEFVEAVKVRMIAAIAALPPLKPFQSATVDCPNCGKLLRADRTRRRAYVACQTPLCVTFEAALKDDGSAWPGSAAG